jgi:glycosyltransferase involved in cell wall biosynthesis
VRIRFVGYVLDATGYGEFSRLVLSSLVKDHELTVTLMRNPNRFQPPGALGELGNIVEPLVGKFLSGAPDVNVINALPVAFEQYRGNSKNIGFTMFESHLVPPTWIYACNRMNGVLVPTEFSREGFIRCGVKAPVHVVHPGADLPPELPPRDETEPFTFFSAFEWDHPHKDPSSLLMAYLQEFEPGERVRLRVKTFSRGTSGHENILHHANMLRQKFRPGKAPEIELVIGTLDTSEMRSLYAKADCYVSTHHGEGWGLPIWEAMRYGVPAIATAYSGNLEFMSPSNSYLVKYQDDGRWANIDVPDLRKTMRHAFQNWKETRALGARARADMGERFSKENCARMFEKAVREICG